MPIFAIIQAVLSRIAIGIVAFLTALGIGILSDSPSSPLTQEDPTQNIEELAIPAREIPLSPQETSMQSEEESRDLFVRTEAEDETRVESLSADSIVDVIASNDEIPRTSEQETHPDTTITEAKSPLSFSQINTETAKALVNVLCTQKVVGAATPITGSGVVIDPRGVIITNAHVAQFFLLKDYPVASGLECVIRTGSPARHTYTAELLYISPEWVRLHAADITNSAPKGTGEHDYAFLRITGRTDPQIELPTTFPFIPVDINSQDIKMGDYVLAAAYPAGFLGNISIHRDLYSVSSIAVIGERFTFIEKTIDLFSLGGTVVSQGGSSGGAVVSDANKLIGIIVTSTKADTTAERDLRAITLGHINRALSEYTGTSIEGLLFGDVVLKAKLFNLSVAPALTNMFLEHLVK